MADISLTYNTIASNITSAQGQCVLILGPELAVDRDGKGYKSVFKGLIKQFNNSKYFDDENLFWFEDDSAKKIIREDVKIFYDNVGDPVLMEMISRIKFPLIINVCPDKSINNIYARKGIQYNFKYIGGSNSSAAYFTKDSKPRFNSLSYPTKDSPIIYNIFGSIDLDLSLILTHSKLYETMEYLLPEKSLPDNIELFLKETVNSFIFLGFKYDSWYYQLICHKLGIKAGLDAKTSLSTPEFDSDAVINIIMKNSFNMEFTKENPSQCIYRLLEACQNDLREKSPNGSYSTFVSYARKDDSNEARENIVDLIEFDFEKDQNNLFQFFRDRNDITYGDSIDSFMTRIGMGKTVIRIISDKYLKSLYCMLEALRMQQYSDKEKRIFTIIMEDAQVNLSNLYKQYWLTQCQTILNDPNKLENGHFDGYVKVYRFMDDFIATIKDEVHLKLNYSDCTKTEEGVVQISNNREKDYRAFFDNVINKLKLE